MKLTGRGLALAVIAALAVPSVAAAHTTETVGEIDVRLGWLYEPAYAEQLNAVQIEVTRGGRPVTGLSSELDVKVKLGDRTSESLEVIPAPEVEGEYHATLIPTEPGAYTFLVSGAVDGEPFSVEVTAGPETFDEITGADAVQFPTTLPSRLELADRIDNLSGQLTDAQKKDNTRTLLLALGLLAIGIGSYLTGRKRRA